MQDFKPAMEYCHHPHLLYARYTKDKGEKKRGTVVLLDDAGEKTLRTIPGFPSIKRVYRLGQGAKRLFQKSEFYAEEKLDGYNVRLFLHQGQIFALTRGGFICPFTTEWSHIWAEETGLREFFNDHPEHVICCEVVGDNPYNRQRDPQLAPGAHFYVFEIVNENGEFLSPEHRHVLAGRYSLPSVPVIGRFHPQKVDPLYDALRELNARGREGVVLKSLDAQRFMKFVTPETDIQDIRDALPMIFDMPAGFFQNRELRVSIFVQELGLDQDEYAQKLGQAFMQGCPSAKGFSESSETYRIYVHSRSTWEELHKQLSRQVPIQCDAEQVVQLKGREMLKITFRRWYKKSTHRYKRMFRGYLHVD